jgi:SAM-dependent methyltransferase
MGRQPDHHVNSMIDLNQIATNLRLQQPNFWVARHQSRVAYPHEGNDFCFTLEADSFWFEHRNHCITTVMRRLPPPGMVFDVGGGNGFVALAVQKAGYDVALVEPGASGASHALARGISPVICSSLEDAGFRDESVPAVGIFDVLEHIDDDITFLGTLRRVLRPDGRLYLTVPAYQFLWSVDDNYAQHCRRYTTSQLSRRLRRAGFAAEFATYFFSLLPLPIWLTRTLPSWLGLKKTAGGAAGSRDHRRPSGLVALLFNQVLRWELGALSRGSMIPFGASCLVVAKPQKRKER